MYFIFEQFLYNAALTLHQYLKPQQYKWLIQGNSIQAVDQIAVEKAKKPHASEHPQSHLQQFLKEVKNTLMQVTVYTIILLMRPQMEEMLIEERRKHKTSIPIYILCMWVEQNIFFSEA